ncbi:MAG TPA: hypothetical protein DCQ29_09275 [Chitinophagaceae bacterium]|nr:hypothetical protein [Chitinophagaceae bacterium]
MMAIYHKCKIETMGKGMHFVALPDNMVHPLLAEGNKRVLCTFKAAPTLPTHSAIQRTKALGYYFYIGKQLMQQLQVKAGDWVELHLQVDTTVYQFEMPEVFAEVLATDPAAADIFGTLTDGNKRSLMHLITQVKSIDKQIERALKIAQQLKAGVTSARVILSA